MSVQQILDTAVEAGDEIGVQVAAYVDGEAVADASAGIGPRTLVHGYSIGKGVAATVVAVLVDRGQLAYDVPVAEYWPEFAARGKAAITVGHVLSHQAGLPYLPADLTPERLFDHASMAAVLAEREPEWPPGTVSAYHGWTFGILIAEIVRRATGRTIDDVLRDDVTTPLGIPGELLFSVPDDVEVAPLHASTWETFLDALPPHAGMFRMAPRAVLPIAELANRRDYLRAGIPASGTATAHGLARMYAALLAGELVSPETLAVATTHRPIPGPDPIFAREVPKSYGFFVGDSGGTIGGLRGFGSPGSGGSIGFADPSRGLAFAFMHTRCTDGSHDTAAKLLAELGFPG